MTAAWTRKEGKRASGGLNQKGVESYRRENPGSKLKTAVTRDPSKLKKGGKAAKRRASFCARMKGMKKRRTSAKTANDPNSRINKSLRAWNCESLEDVFEFSIASRARTVLKGKKADVDKAVDDVKAEVQKKIDDWNKEQQKKLIIWGGIPPALGIASTIGSTHISLKKSKESEERLKKKIMKLKKKDISLEALNEIFEFISKKEMLKMRKYAEPVEEVIVRGKPVHVTHKDARKFKNRRALKIAGAGLGGLGLVLGAHQIHTAMQRQGKHEKKFRRENDMVHGGPLFPQLRRDKKSKNFKEGLGRARKRDRKAMSHA